MSEAQVKILSDDIRPALATMVGDEKLIGPELVDAVIATSISYRAGQTLILYSPIYAVVILLHVDRYKRQYAYALGFEELASFLHRPLDSNANYLTLRYTLVPPLVTELRQRLISESESTISAIHVDFSWGRTKLKENQIGLLKPIVRQTDPSNLRCIKTLDKAALIANIRNGLEDKNDENWFDHMTMGDILTDEDGSKTMIFVNDATRRLHLFVPVSQKGDRCVPGVPRTAFIQ